MQLVQKEFEHLNRMLRTAVNQIAATMKPAMEQAERARAMLQAEYDRHAAAVSSLGQTGPAATIEALMSVTAYFRIGTNRAKDILRAVERAVDNWRKTGRALGMTNHELHQFAEAFEHPERQAAQAAIR